MRWDSLMNRQTRKEEIFCFSLKKQIIKLMFSLGAQEAMKRIKSSQLTGSTSQQTDIWLTGNGLFNPCCSVMLPWPAMRVLSVHLKEEAMPWCKPPWSSKHEDCSYNEALNNCLLSLLTTSYQTFHFVVFILLNWKRISFQTIFSGQKVVYFLSQNLFPRKNNNNKKSLTYHVLIK